MKTVFDNQQCAHVWAQQTQPSGRSASMRFDGATIYSYQTPIARIVKARPDGLADGGVVLITSRTYSATTSSKHTPAVRNAVRHYTMFHVDNCTANSTREHTDNLAEMLKAYDAIKPRLKRARDITYLTDRDGFTAAYQKLCLYASLFDLPAPVRDPNADWHEVQEFRAAAQAKRETPAYLAKKAREAERKAAAEEARQIERVAHEAEQRGKWLSGEAYAIWRGTDEKGGAYLRIHGSEVETSLGARVPMADATHAIAYIRSRMRRAVVWERNGETCPVGQFQIDRIELNGDIKAGCHFIQFAEIDRIGKLLGV